MEALYPYETSVTIYHATRHTILEELDVNQQRCEGLQSCRNNSSACYM
jgi:hypothetical protein